MAQHGSFCNRCRRRGVAGIGVYGGCVPGDRTGSHADHDIQHSVHTLGSPQEADVAQCDLPVDLSACVGLGFGYLSAFLFVDLGKRVASYTETHHGCPDASP